LVCALIEQLSVRREPLRARPNWRTRCEEAGFRYHSMGGTYWDETVCYAFTAAQIDKLEAVTAQLHQLCLAAAEHVVRERRFAEFAIPEPLQELVAESWLSREPTLYGRFDFSWSGTGEPKLLEYNADTPTALLEASVVQWHWLEDTRPDADQFNSLHEKLIERWRAIRSAAPGNTTLHLTCAKDSDEDLGNVDYLRDCALQADWHAKQLFIDELGWDGHRFVDLEEEPVKLLFKLYPWEWLARESFGAHLAARPARLIEPAWKMLLSNKALLVVLWELNYGHPNLLPAYFDERRFAGQYAKKPLLAREGANVTLQRGLTRLHQAGEYGAEGFVYQGLAPLPQFDGRYPVIGSWIVGDEPAGIGIREDDSPITKNSSHFIPHYFE
jgi:glutathionylspermidine synthase